MSADPPDPPATALVRVDEGSPARVEGAGEGPTAATQATIAAMLRGAVDGFGDVVQALLCDLESANLGLQDLRWLWSSQGTLDQEQAYRAAVQQLQWWDTFLGELPCPELISERRRHELRRLAALRSRARIQAREAALAEHRRLVEAEVAHREVDPEQATAILQVHDDPAPGQWRVDVAAYEARALAELPDIEEPVPIVAADLDPARSFAGFHAVDAMRRHPLLAPRAAHLDHAIAAPLRRHLDLAPEAAERHARTLTGIFWIALRRALESGSNQLAISIRLLSQAGERGVQERFTRELLTSWLACLDEIPASDRRRSLASRLSLPGMGRPGRSRPALPEAEARRLIDRDADERPSWWSRLRRGLGMGRQAAEAEPPEGEARRSTAGGAEED